MRTAGIHHITAIASDPLRNLAFYSELLGLRLVKRTVNFDDSGSYHFYFGDNIATSGSILTFFLWPGAVRGRAGRSQVAAATFAISPDSIDYWKQRLAQHRLVREEIAPRFGEAAIRFPDPDGLMIELTGATDRLEVRDWNESPIPAQHRIRGFAAATVEVGRPDLTEGVLTEMLGFRFVAEEGKRRRFEGTGASAASRIDLAFSDAAVGRIAAGNVHHIAFRAADEAEQLDWRQQLIKAGLTVSAVMDRHYFRSIYFREPSGILFEVATDGPGFVVDQSVEGLGQNLRLPPGFEPMRAEIERVLPPLESALVTE